MSDILLEDVLFAARTVYGEARGLDDKAMRGVAHVLMNRWHKRVGDSDHGLAATALRWRQFSAWNEGDPNRTGMYSVQLGSSLFRRCVVAVLQALDEPDFTGGATHYHTKTLDFPAAWGPVQPPCYADEHPGGHVYYNTVR